MVFLLLLILSCLRIATLISYRLRYMVIAYTVSIIFIMCSFCLKKRRNLVVKTDIEKISLIAF